MTAYVGNVNITPHISPEVGLVDVEIAVSPQDTRKFPVTLAAGQGVLSAGTVLAQVTATKKYVKYVNGGSGGVGTAIGILYDSVDTGTDPAGRDIFGNIVTSGILRNSAISGADSGAITSLNARTVAPLDQFIF